MFCEHIMTVLLHDANKMQKSNQAAAGQHVECLTALRRFSIAATNTSELKSFAAFTAADDTACHINEELGDYVATDRCP